MAKPNPGETLPLGIFNVFYGRYCRDAFSPTWLSKHAYINKCNTDKSIFFKLFFEHPLLSFDVVEDIFAYDII